MTKEGLRIKMQIVDGDDNVIIENTDAFYADENEIAKQAYRLQGLFDLKFEND